MKRSGQDAELASEIPLKRVNSTGSAAANDEDEDAHFFLQSQNRSLVVELRKSKSQISESRKELDMMRTKSREMETLVGVIQRSWSQVSTFFSHHSCHTKTNKPHTRIQYLTYYFLITSTHHSLTIHS
jgi:hypothetical protein